MNFSFQIASRYIQSKKGVKFLSLISVITIAGIALGVAVLIMAISILNGFENTVSKNIIKFNAHINITGYSSKPLVNSTVMSEKIKSKIKNKYASFSPYIAKQVLITKKNYSDGIILTGIDTTYAKQSLSRILTAGKINLKKDSYNIIIGKKLALKLKTDIGDKITIISLENDSAPSLANFPIIEQFTVSGIYESGMAQYDDIYAYINFTTAKNIFEFNDMVTGYNINLKNTSEIDSVTKVLDDFLNYPYWVKSYRDINKHIFTWLELQQKPVPIVLGLIIIVAVFNIIGALLMLIIQKTEAIGILKSLGASGKQIIQIFVYQGLFLAGIGIILGNSLAFIISWLQVTYKIITLPEQIYYLSSVPINIDFRIYLLISIVSFMLAFLASLIPSYVASKIQPIKAIKFD